MAKMLFAEKLRQEYRDLFANCVITNKRLSLVNQIVEAILVNKKRYEDVVTAITPADAVSPVPWFFVAVIHNMERSLSFKHHLHNGDPLTARTVSVPAGRPQEGEPPFTWEESAIDSLLLKNIDKWGEWDISGLLYKIEEYNGWGYRLYHANVKTPYLWSFSNNYVKGKYIGDGQWSDEAISAQCGAAVLLKRMSERGLIELK